MGGRAVSMMTSHWKKRRTSCPASPCFHRTREAKADPPSDRIASAGRGREHIDQGADDLRRAVDHIRHLGPGRPPAIIASRSLCGSQGLCEPSRTHPGEERSFRSIGRKRPLCWNRPSSRCSWNTPRRRICRTRDSPGEGSPCPRPWSSCRSSRIWWFFA